VKRSVIACSVAACCLLASPPAVADNCDNRFGGSCRSESTTTIVRIKGEGAVSNTRRGRVSRIKQSRTEKSPLRAKRQLGRSVPVRAESVGEEPIPAATVRAATSATRVVDEGFNTLAAEDYLDPLLEQALMKVRQQILGSALLP
jgi:hypothetical protein